MQNSEIHMRESMRVEQNIAIAIYLWKYVIKQKIMHLNVITEL